MANSDAPRSENSNASQKQGESEIRASFATTASSVKPQSSPLLSSTPPTVAKALIKAYPYLLIVNKLLAVATWTNDDYWINVVLMCLYGFAVLYFETLITWSGHLILVGAVIMYAVLNNRIVEETNLRPTLDDVVQALTTTCIKADILLSPITALALTPYDIKRLLFTTVFLTPLYLVATSLLIKPRTILLHAGLFLISYHSGYSRVTRRLVWKLKITRVVCFYLTGLDFSQARNSSLFAAAFAKVQKSASSTSTVADPSKPVRFTYVIYENQRRWLGIGWTSNLLSYERAPWTDEFLNESSSVDSFELPNPDSSTTVGQQSYLQHSTIAGAHWRWVDKAWRLDITNDGAITLPSGKRSKTTANPTADEGYLYFDNVWKKPSTEDSYSKYTRRRRWVRTAELVFSDSSDVSNNQASYASGAEEYASHENNSKNRKSLRFAEDSEPLSDATVEAVSSSGGPDKKTE
ncbi:uncharacterized protein CXQ87_002758 [Candidozyma duobushaemuli]|uniref:Peroxin/Ferlin domain-containing protein n=2 Tax=Candidozyma TaxID=3303203 RepID=A0ABX8I449_9ASCO|nr:uncharacterized protein CXQ87_002758 [[Candida] duobushaemulonis]PVH14613.1 hypothetical protein CXQ87_002758 [[Candida] duobushaemulonis]QWU87233.1 hypothetical protein CA3LBN_001498 [[Candida] haemuloni]